MKNLILLITLPIGCLLFGIGITLFHLRRKMEIKYSYKKSVLVIFAAIGLGVGGYYLNRYYETKQIRKDLIYRAMASNDYEKF